MALEGGEGSVSRPGCFLPLGKTRYPLYRRLGGPQGRSGRRKISPPPGFDPRTVQPIVAIPTELLSPLSFYKMKEFLYHLNTELDTKDESVMYDVHIICIVWSLGPTTLQSGRSNYLCHDHSRSHYESSLPWNSHTIHTYIYIHTHTSYKRLYYKRFYNSFVYIF